jgi:hypothetical protein
VLFCGEIGTRYTLCVRYTFCGGGPSLGAKSGLVDDFPLNLFPITQPGNGKVARSPRDLSKSDIIVGEKSPPLKNTIGEISKKNKSNFFWGNDYFPFLKLKIRVFVQESAAVVTRFLSFV